MNIIINIDVPELAPAIAFYTAALGLTHSRTLDDDVAELTGASATLYLLQKDPGTPRRQDSRPSTATMTATGLRCISTWWSPDVDAAAARALAAGAKQETGHVDWRGSRCISFGDPFGHGFCFIQFDRSGTYDMDS